MNMKLVTTIILVILNIVWDNNDTQRENIP